MGSASRVEIIVKVVLGVLLNHGIDITKIDTNKVVDEVNVVLDDLDTFNVMPESRDLICDLCGKYIKYFGTGEIQMCKCV